MRRISIALLVLFVSTSLAAQERKCENTNTIDQCTSSIVKSTLVASQEKEVAAEVTGTPTVDSFLGNSTRDFLSVFAAGLQTANISEKEDALTLDWNLRIQELGSDPVKLQAVVRKPTLFKSFSDKLPTDADRTRLKDDLGDFDDLTVSVSYASESKTHGRNLKPHLDLFEAIHGDLEKVQPSEKEFALDLIAKLPELKDFAELDNVTFGAIPESVRERARGITIAAAEAIVASRAKFDQKFKAFQLDRFSDLINNQPQVYFSASRRERASLVGPRETSIKATYEKGFVNVNTFRKFAGGDCPGATTETGNTCAAKFQQYVNDPAIVAGLDASNRLSFSLEYSDSEDYKITDTALTDPFVVKGSRVTNGAFTYGRIVRRDRVSSRDGRVDLSVTYADVRGDKDQDNRFIASAIYTQKMSDTMSLPIGVVWSNRDAHVPDSDRRLSVHFGLVFKVPKVAP